MSQQSGFNTDLNPEHQSMQWMVQLNFVSLDHQEGYQRTYHAHDCSRERAIVKAVCYFNKEVLPLDSLVVYQCVFTS